MLAFEFSLRGKTMWEWSLYVSIRVQPVRKTLL